MVFVTGLVLLYRVQTWERFVHVMIGWLFFPATFAFSTPWVVFDTAELIEQVAIIMNTYASGTRGYAVDNPWLSMAYLYRFIAVYGLGVPAAALALMTPYIAWRERPHSAFLRQNSLALYVLILLCYLIPYSLVVLRPAMTFNADQLTTTSLPQLALLAGVGAAWLRRRLSSGALAGALLTVGVLLPPLVVTVQMVRQFTVPDTRTQMQRWMYANLPEGAPVHLNGPYNVPLDAALYPWTHTYAYDFPSAAAMREEYGADYVVVSDAIYTYYQRSPAMHDADFRQQARDYLYSLAAEYERWRICHARRLSARSRLCTRCRTGTIRR